MYIAITLNKEQSSTHAYITLNNEQAVKTTYVHITKLPKINLPIRPNKRTKLNACKYNPKQRTSRQNN